MWAVSLTVTSFQLEHWEQTDHNKFKNDIV